MEPVIELQNFTFKYPNSSYDVINDANFSIYQGDSVLIFGPSGSGKSTLCYSLSGLIPWSIKGLFKGKIKVLGRYLTEITPKELAGSIGLVMQNPDNQFINLTVFDELIFGAENLKIPEEKIRSRLTRIVELLNLQHLLDRNVLQLSGGEKQRVVLGSVLMMKPKILILDEPLAFLDAQGRLELLHHISKLKRTFTDQLTILIAEHRIQEILPFVNKFIWVDDGITKLYSDINAIDAPYFHEGVNYKKADLINQKSSTNAKPILFSYELMLKKFSFVQSLGMPKEKTEKSLGNPLLSFDKVSFDYIQDLGKHNRQIKQIFNKISFEIFPGELVGVVGPNGSGKTTLLYLIAGILKPDQGKILFNGEDLNNITYAKYARNIGLIFQNPESQLLKNTIKKELEFGPKNFGLLDLLDESKINELINLIFSSQEPRLRLKSENIPITDINPFNLSWGQKRRLNLASIYAYQPVIYLLDEPFTGQDFRVRKTIMDTLVKLLGTDKSAVISSHDEEILNLCSKVFLIEENKFEIYEKSPSANMT